MSQYLNTTKAVICGAPTLSNLPCTRKLVSGTCPYHDVTGVGDDQFSHESTQEDSLSPVLSEDTFLSSDNLDIVARSKEASRCGKSIREDSAQKNRENAERAYQICRIIDSHIRENIIIEMPSVFDDIGERCLPDITYAHSVYLDNIINRVLDIESSAHFCNIQTGEINTTGDRLGWMSSEDIGDLGDFFYDHKSGEYVFNVPSYIKDNDVKEVASYLEVARRGAADIRSVRNIPEAGTLGETERKILKEKLCRVGDFSNDIPDDWCSANTGTAAIIACGDATAFYIAAANPSTGYTDTNSAADTVIAVLVGGGTHKEAWIAGCEAAGLPILV